MTTRSGTFSDGYDLYPALVSCEFQIDPIIAAPMRPFAQLKVTFLRVQLGWVAGRAECWCCRGAAVTTCWLWLQSRKSDRPFRDN